MPPPVPAPPRARIATVMPSAWRWARPRAIRRAKVGQRPATERDCRLNRRNARDNKGAVGERGIFAIFEGRNEAEVLVDISRRQRVGRVSRMHSAAIVASIVAMIAAVRIVLDQRAVRPFRN